MNFRDVAIRAGKTFVQCFLGVLVPELCMVLSSAVPDTSFWTVALPPLLCAALAAGISAAWNIVSLALAPDVPTSAKNVHSLSSALEQAAPEFVSSDILATALDVFKRVQLDMSALELAASELAASDYSVSALSKYAVASSQLAASALTACNLSWSWFPADELPF